MLYSRRLIYISLPLWWFTFFKWIYLPVHIHSTFQLLVFWHRWHCYSSHHMGWRFCGPILFFCDLLLFIFSSSLHFFTKPHYFFPCVTAEFSSLALLPFLSTSLQWKTLQQEPCSVLFLFGSLTSQKSF